VNALQTLAEQLRAEDTPISPHVVDPAESPQLGELAASGPGSAAAPAEYALVVEAVREGYLLHYEEPRLLAGQDSDLAAVAILSDLITHCARLQAEGETAPIPNLWRTAAEQIAAPR
jgi:hypothetical protein